jgi:hypothetical protein
MTVEQLVAFIRSSIQLKQPDKEVARYVGRLKLTERLEARVVEELQALGAGPRTLEALHELSEESKSLPLGKQVQVEVPRVEIPAPGDAEQKAVIRKAREYAMSYIRQLPDFLCTQVTRRYFDPTGMEFWRISDTVTARLSYVDDREDYKIVLVNSRPMNTDMNALGGAVSTGEFGSMMRELFEPETGAEFAWERWATLRGRRTHVYRYRVAQQRSKWQVSYERTVSVTPGYHGLIFIDRDTNSVVRITLNAELPPSFPVQQAATTLDYDVAEIGDQKFMLPLKGVVRMREGKLLLKNDVEFRMYRKFSVDAVLKFDADPETPAPLPEEPEKP